MVEPAFARRPSPIILIIPIVLTIAGIALTVMLYLRHYDKTDGTLVKEQEQARKVAQARQDLEKARQREQALVDLLGYGEGDYQTWLDNVNVKGGQADVRTLDARQATIDSLNTTTSTLSSQNTGLEAEIVKWQTDTQTLVEQKSGTPDKPGELGLKRTDLTTLQKTYTPRTGALIKELAAKGKEVVEKEAEAQRAAEERRAARQRQVQTLTALDSDLERLQEALDERTSKAQRIDGRIVTVPAGMGTAVIDIGRQQRVRKGLLFKVVGKGQVIRDPTDPTAAPLIPQGTTFKGDIEIVLVYETQSLGRVLDLDFSDPILPGDAIYSPGFDPGYQPRFVIVGQVDLTGDGVPDWDLLKELIAGIGGVMTENVSVRTDFLLMGEEWPTDNPETRTRYWRDQAQIKAAEELKVTFLSVRRFLSYVGVTPAQVRDMVAQGSRQAPGAR